MLWLRPSGLGGSANRKANKFHGLEYKYEGGKNKHGPEHDSNLYVFLTKPSPSAEVVQDLHEATSIMTSRVLTGFPDFRKQIFWVGYSECMLIIRVLGPTEL